MPQFLGSVDQSCKLVLSLAVCPPVSRCSMYGLRLINNNYVANGTGKVEGSRWVSSRGLEMIHWVKREGDIGDIGW